MNTHQSKPKSYGRRNVLIGGACFAAAGLAWAGTRGNTSQSLPEGELEKVIPDQFDSWRVAGISGLVTPPRSELSERTYNDVLTRIYENDQGQMVMLLVAYGAFQGRDMQLHRPELCYPAAGFAIQSTDVIQLRIPNSPTISAQLMNTLSTQRGEQLLYWTRIGTEFPITPFQQRLAVVRQNLEGKVPDGVLVRASIVGGDPQQALPIMQKFLAGLIDASPAKARKILIGQA